jgi:hypothetical protein
MEGSDSGSIQNNYGSKSRNTGTQYIEKLPLERDRDQSRLDQAHSSYKQNNDNNYWYHMQNFKTDTTGKTALSSGSFFLTGQLMLAPRLVSEENFL